MDQFSVTVKKCILLNNSIDKQNQDKFVKHKKTNQAKVELK